MSETKHNQGQKRILLLISDSFLPLSSTVSCMKDKRDIFSPSCVRRQTFKIALRKKLFSLCWKSCYGFLLLTSTRVSSHIRWAPRAPWTELSPSWQSNPVKGGNSCPPASMVTNAPRSAAWDQEGHTAGQMAASTTFTSPGWSSQINRILRNQVCLWEIVK